VAVRIAAQRTALLQRPLESRGVANLQKHQVASIVGVVDASGMRRHLATGRSDANEPAVHAESAMSSIATRWIGEPAESFHSHTAGSMSARLLTAAGGALEV
jgi:hypothetical protein